MLLVTTMWPWFLSTMCGKTALVNEMVPRTLSWNMASFTEIPVVSRISPLWVRPPLFTKMSIWRKKTCKLMSNCQHSTIYAPNTEAITHDYDKISCHYILNIDLTISLGKTFSSLDVFLGLIWTMINSNFTDWIFATIFGQNSISSNVNFEQTEVNIELSHLPSQQ